MYKINVYNLKIKYRDIYKTKNLNSLLKNKNVFLGELSFVDISAGTEPYK